MVRSPLAQILGKGADRPAALALLLLSLLGLLSPSLSTSPQGQHLAGVRGGSAPYGPHAPPRRPPFFQGWYTRVTAPGLAFAVVLGQHIPGPGPAQHDGDEPAKPPVLCMVLLQRTDTAAGSALPLAAYTRYFDALDISSNTIKGNSSGSGSGGGQDSAGQGGQGGGVGGSGQEVPEFSLSTLGPGLVGRDALGLRHTGPSVVGEAQGGVGSGAGRLSWAAVEQSQCQLRVEEQRVQLKASFPGSLTLTVTSQPGPAAALPWSPSSAAPESWVSGLGALVALHYATLSLATQVDWSLELPGPQPQPQPAAGGQGGPPSRRLQGQGVAHLEAQYGRGFPGRWLWAQGHVSSGGEGAGGGHGGSPAQLSPHQLLQPGSAGGGAALQAAWVLAGGDLPHVLSPPLPPIHTFLFSYRDPGSGVAVAVDPRDPAVPGLGVREQLDACRGTLNLTLSTLWHVVQIEMAAPPGSFTPVACPTQHGFVTLSVESYAAAARIRIWQRTLPAKIASALRSAAHKLRRNYGPAGAVSPSPDTAFDAYSVTGQSLLVDMRMEGAALEYGGTYRCDQEVEAEQW
ncbi:hypothetical protein QJQ45_021374 [Haematococcus lacustris]|nr:hypothetical protein QJQ45_021374 [Haematococcus lacustris]